MPGIVCAKCGFTTLYEDEKPVFCAKCANRFRTGRDFEDDLREALNAGDYEGKHKRLLALREKYGCVYEIELEILLIGRLYEKGGKPDFYRIPYWPLSAFEKPGEFSKKDRKKMLETFFENEEVMCVKALQADEDAFWRDYLFKMGVRYIDLFIKGSNANSTFLGFRRRAGDTMRRSAWSLGVMLANIDKSDYPDERIRRELIVQLKKAFTCVFDAEEAASALESVLKNSR